MMIKNEFSIPASKTEVWALFQDVPKLAEYLPGCSNVEPLNEKQYRAKMETQVNKFMTIKFDVEGELLEARDETHMEAQMTGKPSALAGLFRTNLVVDVEASVDNTTLVKYTMTSSLTGRLASIGELMMKGVIVKNADQFAQNVIEHFTQAAQK